MKKIVKIYNEEKEAYQILKLISTKSYNNLWELSLINLSLNPVLLEQINNFAALGLLDISFTKNIKKKNLKNMFKNNLNLLNFKFFGLEKEFFLFNNASDNATFTDEECLTDFELDGFGFMMISFPNIWCLNETFNNVEEVKNWEDYFFKGKGRHTDFIRKIGLNKENEKFKELIWNEYSIAHCAKIPKHFQMKEQKFLMRLDVLSLELEKRVLDYLLLKSEGNPHLRDDIKIFKFLNNKSSCTNEKKKKNEFNSRLILIYLLILSFFEEFQNFKIFFQNLFLINYELNFEDVYSCNEDNRDNIFASIFNWKESYKLEFLKILIAKNENDYYSATNINNRESVHLKKNFFVAVKKFLNLISRNSMLKKLSFEQKQNFDLIELQKISNKLKGGKQFLLDYVKLLLEGVLILANLNTIDDKFLKKFLNFNKLYETLILMCLDLTKKINVNVDVNYIKSNFLSLLSENEKMNYLPKDPTNEDDGCRCLDYKFRTYFYINEVLNWIEMK